MTKLKFLLSLHDRLSHLPQDEVEERLSFYSEMIEDRMEDGLSEEEAVAAVGTVEEIAAQIEAELSPARPATVITEPKRGLKAWEIVLLVLGAPIWLSLLIAAVAVVFSLYVALWSVIIAFWAVFVSLAACALAGVLAGGGFALGGYGAQGAALVGAGFVCAGLAVLFFFGIEAATKGTVLLTQKLAQSLKGRLHHG